MRKILIWAVVLSAAAVSAWMYFAPAPAPDQNQEQTAAVSDGADAPGPYLDIAVAGEANGTITIDLYAQNAPAHVDQILALAEGGQYDGVVFHRVIEGFMAQTGDVQHGRADGDLRRAGTGASDLPDIPAEFSDINFARGIVGMARAQDPNSANSQFFIMFEEGAFLNGQYTVVGEVTAGMDVVDAIKRGAGPNGSVIGTPDQMQTVTVRQ